MLQHFDQKLQKTENFYLATIFNVKHLMSSFISIFFAEGLGCQKIQVSAFRCNLGCAPYAQNWVFFFQIYEIEHFCWFVTQLVKKLEI